jgi:hypothetical protein
VFFINGDLKGHELLYIKNQDMFVPLKENWINYLINRKPNILGSSVDRNLSSMGQRQPDFTQLSRVAGEVRIRQADAPRNYDGGHADAGQVRHAEHGRRTGRGRQAAEP